MNKKIKQLIVVVLVAVAGYFGYNLILTPDETAAPTEEVAPVTEEK